MYKYKCLLLITILSTILFSGCVTHSVSSSSMLRTVGVGESAMPIDEGSFGIEFFNDQATIIDVITTTTDTSWDIFNGDEISYVTGGKGEDKCRYYGINSRFGFTDLTELKIGFFRGNIENGEYQYSSYDENGLPQNSSEELSTSFSGVQVGLKQLLSEYSNPHRISLYLDGKYLSTSSDGDSEKYDGESFEFKSAIIYGYLPNPTIRSFPSVMLYYSLANTRRFETIPGVAAKKHPHSAGLELNYNLDMGPLYANFSGGIEREISDDVKNEVTPYFGVKLGFLLNRNN